MELDGWGWRWNLIWIYIGIWMNEYLNPTAHGVSCVSCK
jgi:hypothetical protein